MTHASTLAGKMARGLRGPSPLWLVPAGALLSLWPTLAELFEYDRARIAAGEVWRLFTGHITHVSFEHCAWDAAAFVLAGLVCRRWSPPAFRAALLWSVALIPAALWVLQSDLALYRGLSGVDSALSAAAGCLVWRDAIARGDRIQALAVIALGAGFAAKIAYECWTGSTVFLTPTDGMIAVPLAHAAGAVVGVVATLVSASRSTM